MLMHNAVTTAEIHDLLDRHRPDRYDVDDHSWRNPVVAAIAGRIPPRQAAQVAAERLVGDCEGKATRSVNSLLRKINQERVWPIPGTIDVELNRPLSIGNERVCLRAAQARDFELWAIHERRDAAQEFAARSGACDGAEWIAETMRNKQWALFSDGMQP